MEFVNLFAKIGQVVAVKENGIIKARVPSMFDEEDYEKLPDIIYCPFGGGNSYSAPALGDSILVVGDHTDPLTLFWIPINETSISPNLHTNYDPQSNPVSSSDQGDSDVLINKPLDGGTRYASLYIDGDGCHIKDGSTEVIISDSSGVTIKSSNISLGESGSNIKMMSGSHQIARADITDAKLTALSAAIIQLTSLLIKVCAASPYTAHVSGGLAPMQATITKLQSDVESTGSGCLV